MKILNKYRFIKGAGGGDPDTPALVPPESGQGYRKSISMSSSVDILCEGPIYGLVDQFGKKVYGLDMLKGIYLNKIPAMNISGEYNFRNIVMEINLGTENQKPLVNFDQVIVYKAANFKLLGKIDPNEKDLRYNPSSKRNEDFTAWAKGGGEWASFPQDPFFFIHRIRNKDVRKIKIAFVIEQLYDTVDVGDGPGSGGKLGTQRSMTLNLAIRYGLEGSKTYAVKNVIIDGIVTSPYAYMVGEDESSLDTGGQFGSSIVNSLSSAPQNSRRYSTVS